MAKINYTLCLYISFILQLHGSLWTYYELLIYMIIHTCNLSMFSFRSEHGWNLLHVEQTKRKMGFSPNYGSIRSSGSGEWNNKTETDKVNFSSSPCCCHPSPLPFPWSAALLRCGASLGRRVLLRISGLLVSDTVGEAPCPSRREAIETRSDESQAPICCRRCIPAGRGLCKWRSEAALAGSIGSSDRRQQ
jgi:hypothetical protein